MIAIVRTGMLDSEDIIMSAMDVRGYSHMSSEYTDAMGRKLRAIHYRRQGAVSLDSELRKKGIYAVQIKNEN